MGCKQLHKNGRYTIFYNSRREDLTGRIFGNLTILKYLGRYGHRNYWKFRCCCGKEGDVARDHLLEGRVSSCGCKLRRKGKESLSWTGYEEISGCQWKQIQHGAKRKSRDLEFDISIEYIWSLFLQQNRKCAVSGVDISLNKNKKNLGNASLDRIDSYKGYIKGNIQWVHKEINRMKWSLSQERLIEWCEIISNFQNKNGK